MINSFLPCIICFIVSFGLFKKIDVFETFIQGVKKGATISIKIFPTLIGLVTAVFMLRSSGAIEIFSVFLSPILNFLNIPIECAGLMLLKPISGGGGLAMGSELIKNFGADSYIGRIVAVMLASSETSFYTMSVYFGCVGIKNTKYTIFAVLTADIMAFIMSVYSINYFFT